ncbi:hypothetical protein HMPREF1580_00319 [Gardnerella vaginalis JCP8070]|nr:hypothetical protein HMPREF1580_00319 [Gardnerella vaginalis JCP8070]
MAVPINSAANITVNECCMVLRSFLIVLLFCSYLINHFQRS